MVCAATTTTGIIDASTPNLSRELRAWLEIFDSECTETENELKLALEMPPAPNGDVLDAIEIEFDPDEPVLEFDPNWDKLEIEVDDLLQLAAK